MRELQLVLREGRLAVPNLYDGLLKDARYAIARQRKSKEALEDEDD